MRILLTTELYQSGQSTHVIDLASQLNNLGHSVQIVVTGIFLKDFTTSYGAILKASSIPYLVSKNIQQIHRLIQDFQPDVLHSHSSTIFALTSTLAKHSKRPYILTCHGLGFSHPKYQRSLQEAAQLIAVGDNSAKELDPEYTHKLAIIPNGIDTGIFLPKVKEKRLHIYYVGRVNAAKLTALSALYQAVESMDTMDLTVVGNHCPAFLQVRFLPWQTNLQDLLGHTNIVAACGRTAREALSCGNAVLLLNHKYDGIISPKIVKRSDFSFSGNTQRYPLHSIRHDLEQFVADRRRLTKLQSFSRRYATRHLTSQEMAVKTLLVYEKALQLEPIQGPIRLPVRKRIAIPGWGLSIGV